MKGSRIIALALSGAATVALQSTAAAQTAPPSTAVAGATDQAAHQSAEIVVTANKRVERLQDVPVSVGVVTGDQIVKQNVMEVGDLVRSTPALNSAGPLGALSIRGVGSISFARSAEGSVDRRTLDPAIRDYADEVDWVDSLVSPIQESHQAFRQC